MRFVTLLFNFSLNLLLLKLSKTRIVILSRKSRLSQFNAYVKSELREHFYNLDHNLQRDIKIVFINPNEIPNQALKELYSKHAKFICINLHKSRGFRKLALRVILRILEAIAVQGGFVSPGSSRTDPKNWYILTRCRPVIKPDEVSVRVTSKEYQVLSEHINLDEKFCLLAYRKSEYYQQYVDVSQNRQAASDFSYRNPNFAAFVPLIE